MSEQPAPGWYDHPDDPSLYRYWDGTMWTDHTSPKVASQPEPSWKRAGQERYLPVDASGTMSETWTLFGNNFWQVFGIAVLAFVGIAAAGVLVFVGVFSSLEDTNFDGVEEFQWTAVGVVLSIIATIIYLAAIATAFPAAQYRIETARLGKAASIEACISLAFRRAPRSFGRYLLIMLCYVALIAFVSLLALVNDALAVVVALALGVYLLPFFIVAGGGIAVAPRGFGIIRHTLRTVPRQWAKAAGASYLMFVLLFVMGLVWFVTLLIPIVNIVSAIFGYFVFYTTPMIVSHLQWLRLEGGVEDEIRALAGK